NEEETAFLTRPPRSSPALFNNHQTHPTPTTELGDRVNTTSWKQSHIQQTSKYHSINQKWRSRDIHQQSTHTTQATSKHDQDKSRNDQRNTIINSSKGVGKSTSERITQTSVLLPNFQQKQTKWRRKN